MHIPLNILLGTGFFLLMVFILGRVFGHQGTGFTARALEFIGMNWMAVLFLIFVPLLATDLLTGFGLFFSDVAPSLRGLAIIAGCVLSTIALFQGMRSPVIKNYEVHIDTLPEDIDGKVLIALSDLHIGSLIGEKWLETRVDQLQQQRPDLVLLLGDIFEGHGGSPDDLIPILERITAPLGKWAVTGNHEFHRDPQKNTDILTKAGFKVLHDSWIEIRPGLILAGVDDLTARERAGMGGDPISTALRERPAGTTIFLSHTPWEAERVAAYGAELMLSGHTHGGQIWPFGYLVRLTYPLIGGRYRVNNMTVIVSRGAGTWGPRMRLWRPGEIVRVTLRK